MTKMWYVLVAFVVFEVWSRCGMFWLHLEVQAYTTLRSYGGTCEKDNSSFSQSLFYWDCVFNPAYKHTL